jgi:CTP:molybdopterin cytidylyltransferase MocA
VDVLVSDRTAATPALVILAAGASRRLGECKALVAITPRNPLELLSSAGSVLDAATPLVVAGAHHEEIRAALPAGLELAFNAAWEAGQSSSVSLARALRPGFDLCLAPVDVPLVPRAVFERLLRAWRAAGSPPRGWLAPFWSAERMSVIGSRDPTFGHPIVVGRELLAELAHLDRTATLRDLRGLADPLLAVEVASRAVLDDLDTPLDLERLRASARD